MPLDWYAPGALGSDVRLQPVSADQARRAPAGVSLLDPIANGVDVAHYRPSPTRSDYALMLGRVAREKGFHDAIDAARLNTLWPEGAAMEARAAVLPALPRGRLSGLRVALDLEADGPLREFRLNGGSFAGQLDDGLLDLGPGRQIAPRRLELALRLTRDHVVLDVARLSLASPARDAALSQVAARGGAGLRAHPGTHRLGGLEVQLRDQVGR